MLTTSIKNFFLLSTTMSLFTSKQWHHWWCHHARKLSYDRNQDLW